MKDIFLCFVPCSNLTRVLLLRSFLLCLCYIDACKGEKWCASFDEAEALALEAIRSLHRQLDDDSDGNIDLSETKDVGFVTFIECECGHFSV